MSMYDLKSNSNGSLVDKILEQGQRLRNSMVQAVLNYDPFNTEVLNYSPRSEEETRKYVSARSTDNSDRKTSRSDEIERVHKYLRGEEMCMNEEMQALETLRSMSPNSLVQSTTCLNKCHCKESCDICSEYETKLEKFPLSPILEQIEQTHNHKYSERSVQDNHVDKSQSHERLDKKYEEYLQTQKSSSTKLKAVKETFKENQRLLKFIDSIKVTVYSLKLNSAGNTKILSAEHTNKPYLTTNSSYFVEYTIPEILTKNILKSRAKVNSGLNPDKTIRFCSKKLQSESVYFKQHSIHQISNVHMLDLSNIKIEFKVSYRSVRQRSPVLLGKAHFVIGYLLTTPYFSGDQELALQSENSPIGLGSLKVSVQLGCDKLYFGKEFIDAITCSKENTNLSETDSIHKLSDTELPIKQKQEKLPVTNKIRTPPQKIVNTSSEIEIQSEKEPKEIPKVQDKPKIDDETFLLYALIHIFEVRLLTSPLNSYIICRGFSRDDTLTSKTIYNDFKPIFNLHQIIPILFDEDFVNRLRDNYVIVEVWEKKDDAPDNLIGISKLPLHQLYVAYRNPAIVKHLFKNPSPVIGLDWWEPIVCPINSVETGQLRALIALGSSTQIETLESGRELREKYIPPPKTTDIVEDRRKIHSSTSLHSDYNLKPHPSVVHFDVPEENLKVTSDRHLSRASSVDKLNTSNFFPTRSNTTGISSSERVPYSSIDRFNLEVTSDKNLSRSSSVDKLNSSNFFPTHRSNTTGISSFERIPYSSIDRLNLKVTSDKYLSRDSSVDKLNTNNFLPNSSNKTGISSFERVPYSSIDKLSNINYFQQTSDSTYEKICDTYSKRFENLDNLTHSRRTITVSDKCVQEPEIEITPSVVSLNKVVETTNRSRVDASTQSDIKEMDSEKDKNSANSAQNQRDFLNTFLEQLLTARDLSHRNRHVENSTNTEHIPETTRNSVVDNKSSTITSESQIDSNKNSTFPQNSINTSASVRNTSDLLNSLQKALSVENKNELNKTLDYLENDKDISESFKAHILIENALHIPSRKKCKSKRNKNKNLKHNEEILPSCYVTFKGYSDKETMITAVVPKSTSPKWDYRCDISLPSDLLLNNQKRLIFKVWRKANGPSLQPNFQTDIVLGFAAVDLTVLLSGLPSVQGWFNIVDFSSKCNGQIKINVTPLENLSKFNDYKRSYVPEKLHSETPSISLPSVTQKVPETEPEITENSMPSELLSRALKRKFTELDEITQRLRKRLSAVTNDDSDISNDEFADEFERDLNTICVETEPFTFSEDKMDDLRHSDQVATSSKLNLINFDSDNGSSATMSEINVPTVQENLSKLDTHLTEGKLKIDSLLEKLSLLTGDDNQNKSDRSFSSRYVSGCSINHEGETSAASAQVLKDIGLDRDIDPDLIFNPQLFQQMFTASLDSTPRLDSLEFMSSVHCTTLKNLVQDSTSSGSTRDLQSVSSSSLSDTNITRQAPDGAGNVNNN